MKTKINEALPALIPEFPYEIAGQQFTLRFDVNINKTKKGIKLQFVNDNLPQDIRMKQDLANKISAELQQRFGDAQLQILLDLENPYNNVIGFLIPLPSLANYMMEHVFQGEAAPPEEAPAEETPEQGEEEQPAEELPAEETPAEEPMKETLMRRAGLK